MSVYLRTGIGMTGENLEILHKIAGLIRAIGLPFVISGDWNVAPQSLEASGWSDVIGACVVAPGCATYSVGEMTSEIDFFVVDRRIVDAKLVVACEVLYTNAIAKLNQIGGWSKKG